MPGDPTSSNDDDLLNQIDELKARMDRLMRGGSSTSNSALLTEEVKAKQGESEESRPGTPPDTAANRTRVRDLIGPEDTEVVEVYPGRKAVVPFPEHLSNSSEQELEPEPSPVATTETEPQPVPRSEPARPVGGSVIPVEEDLREPRPSVTTFDELGSAIQQELAKDTSVPPLDAKKGPDLASRFGSVVDQSAADQPEPPVAADDAVVAPPEEQAVVDEPEIEVEESAEDVEYVEYEEYEEDEARPRSNAGAVAAIWAFVAIASGAIATLHFTGLI